MRIILIYLVVILVAGGLGYYLFTMSKPVDTSNLPGTAYEVLNQIHIEEGSTDHPKYNSNPPTSGWHWPQPASCLAYSVTQPDERLIHNLEHGGIWISYKSSVDAATKTKLNDFAVRFNNVLVEPRDANDANISLAAWGRLLNMDTYDEAKVIEFIDAFMGQGPEKVGCSHTGA